MADRQYSEEELENMSPEQISELQKQNCLFCGIVSGKIPSKKIYEDDKCMAILDINPVAKGHVLLIPKEHAVVLPMLSDDVIKHLGVTSQKLSKAMIVSMGIQGTNIFAANGAIAGQRAPHAMIHVIPRAEEDGITCFELPEKAIAESDIEQMQKLFAQKLGTNTHHEDEQKKKEIKEKTGKTEKNSDEVELETIDLHKLNKMLK